MVLYVNCCPREDSRTEKIAKVLLEQLGEYEEIDVIKEEFLPLKSMDIEQRETLIATGNYSDPIFHYAKEFAFADIIVIAAPYWDLSFPASLKTFIENIYVQGLVSKYNAEGTPLGLCKAKKLYYVTTAGGPYDRRYSFDYLDTLAKEYWGIEETELIYAEKLDIEGIDVDEIIDYTCDEIRRSFT